MRTPPTFVDGEVYRYDQICEHTFPERGRTGKPPPETHSATTPASSTTTSTKWWNPTTHSSPRSRLS